MPATKRKFAAPVGLLINSVSTVDSSIASTSPSSGAFVITGGAGIGQSVSVGGRLQMFNSSNYTAFVSSASGNTVYTLPATSPATGSSVLQSTSAGVMSWVPMVASASSGTTSANVNIVAAGASNLVHSILFTPVASSSGSAISSDSTITFNPSTEILNVSGLAITAGTASTNNVTGALVVRGGLGVSGQLSFVSASMGFTGITYNPTMAFIGATSSSPITLTVLTDNSLNWEGSQGSVFSIDNNLSSGEIFSVSDISGLPIISASAGQTVNINEFGGFTQIGNGSLNSSSTTTGSLIVNGGLGITGNVAIGGTFIRSSWTVGEVIATRVYNNTDLGMGTTTTISSGTYTNVATITYTPKSTTSHLWIEFDANYILNSGSAADDFFSRITVAGSAIVEKNQIFINALGGGTRSGVIFPISGRYTNTTTSGIAITVQAKWGTSDDAISVYGNSTSGYMRIQEIGR